jgi:hypothetical protein
MTIDRENHRYTSADLLYSAKITADVAAPNAADSGVECTASGLKGVRYINFQCVIRNAADDAAGTTACWLWPWFYFPELPGLVAARWVQQVGIKFHLASEIAADTNGVKGNGYQITKPAGATRVAWSTDSAPDAANVLHLIVTRDT